MCKTGFSGQLLVCVLKMSTKGSSTKLKESICSTVKVVKTGFYMQFIQYRKEVCSQKECVIRCLPGPTMLDINACWPRLNGVCYNTSVHAVYVTVIGPVYT